MSLTKEQLKRYYRHLLLPEIGEAGQEKLLDARVLVVGAGGLGCPAALYLAAAGVGHIGLMDFDRVDESNLQRQVLYSTGDVGQMKVEAAAKRLRALNPDVEVIPIPEQLTSLNADEIIPQYDYILDGTDNFATRYLVNDACVLFGKTNVYGSVFRFEGQVSILAHQDGPCYRCMFPVPPGAGEIPNCAAAGVLGVLPGQIGTAQATEAIKLIVGCGTPLIGQLLVFDALGMNWRKMRIARNPNCPICGDNPEITELQDYEVFCGEVHLPEGVESKPAEEVLELCEAAGDELLLLDVRLHFETEIAPGLDGSVLVPLAQLPDRIGEFEPYKTKTVVAYCSAGTRSIQALEILKNAGFENLINMAGGLDSLPATE